MRILLLFAVFLFPFFCLAQANRFSVSVDKNSIQLGEPFLLNIEAEVSQKDSSQWIKLDSLEHFEILERLTIDTIEQGYNYILRQSIKLTSWDSGKWKLPAISFNGKHSDPIAVTVSFSPFNPEQDYHDIKEIIPVEKPKRILWYWWLLMGMLILVIGILIFPSGKKSTSPKPAAPVYRNAYADAMSALKELSARSEAITRKEFYTALKDIFRSYLRKGLKMETDAVSSDLLVAKINELKINEATRQSAITAVREADLVKFAKADATKEEMDNSVNAIKNIITEIEHKS